MQVPWGFASRVNLSWIQTGSVARQSMGKCLANPSQWSPVWSPECSLRAGLPTEHCRGVGRGPCGTHGSTKLGEPPGEMWGACAHWLHHLPGRAACLSAVRPVHVCPCWMQQPEFTHWVPCSSTLNSFLFSLLCLVAVAPNNWVPST